MVRNLVLTAIIAMGIIYIFFIPADPVGFKILMKLIPMALIILFALTTRPLFSRTYKRIVIGGLLVCMIADGVIYWFLPGLITFFIGHIFYIFAFRHAAKKSMPRWAAVPLTPLRYRHGYLDCRFTIFCWPNRARHRHYRLHRRYFNDGLDGYPHTNEASYHRRTAVHFFRFSSCNRSIRLRNSIPRCIRYGDVLCRASFPSSQHWKSGCKVFRKPEQSDKIE